MTEDRPLGAALVIRDEALQPDSDPYVRLTSLEVAMGVPSARPAGGRCAPASAGAARRHPVRELESVVRRAAGSGRVFVSFSGGRDSSAVLAVAARVAREDGAEPPVPVTYVYPEVAGTEESAWQDAVLRHLGLTERVVITVTDQHRLLGVDAREGMRRRGLVWPASLHLHHSLFTATSGSTLLTGEGGDEVLAAHRITPLVQMVRRRRRPSWAALRGYAPMLVPDPLGARRQARLMQEEIAPWLLGAARVEYRRAVAADSRAPWRWDAATRLVLSRSLVRVFEHNYRAIGAEYDVRVVHPLLNPGFVDALAVAGGVWGYPSRTAAMRALFGDLLPENVVSRRSKAWFNATRFGTAERAFARRWRGEGLSPAWVDTEMLRAAWLADEPGGPLDLALHAAWMASEQLPSTGSRSPTPPLSPRGAISSPSGATG